MDEIQSESYWLNHDDLKKALLAYLILYKNSDVKAGDKFQIIINGDDENDLTIELRVFKKES